ncbi:MAG TPA: hypothetical protein VFP27_09550, partial [Mycobacterium sp.]|nr:hypothetical protein [Mycobacterium sp.]
ARHCPPALGLTASGFVCSTACNATAPARCGSIRDAATVRRDPASNSARAWVFRETDRHAALAGLLRDVEQ